MRETEKIIDIVPNILVDAGYLRLPFTGDQFRDFMRNLLGSPQAINGFVDGSFEVGADDLRSLHQLLLQRVEQQNKGILALFSAHIGFSDNSSVELNTLDGLVSYREVRPVVTMSLHLKWVFIVQFQDKETPERQTIQVSFRQWDKVPNVIDHEGMEFFSRAVRGISFRIEHTARTWGADIEGLISGHLQTLIKSESPTRGFVRKHSGRIALGMGGSLFVSCLVGAMLTTQHLAVANIEKVRRFQNLMSGSSPEAISKRLDYVMELVAGGAWPQYYLAVVVFLLLSLAAAIILAVWTGESADSSEPSFILLSKQDANHKTFVTARLERTWRSFMMSILVSIVTGVAGNLVFKWLFG